MARRSFVALAVVAVTGLACAGLKGKPAPPDRQDLVGSWSAVGVALDLTADGTVRYENNTGPAMTELNGPITEWTDDGFVVGVFGVGSTFHVEDPPHLVGDHWQTRIDGITLTRPSPEPDGVPERRGDRGRKRR